MAYSPTPIRRESVISQAAQEICRFIEAEKLGAGDALPPETRLSAERLTAAEIGELERALVALEQAIARSDMAAAKAAHDAFHGLLLASARNPLLVAMFNQAQVARLSNVAPEHKGFSDPQHLAHHRALLRALKKRDARAASAVVRRHFQSLGLMLEFVTRARKKPQGQVLALV